MKVSFPAALDHVWSATSKTALLASPITSVNSAETIIFLQWTRPSATIAIFLDAWPAPLTSSVAPVSQDSPLISMSTVYFPAATNVKWPTARVVTNKTNALTVPLATSWPDQAVLLVLSLTAPHAVTPLLVLPVWMAIGLLMVSVLTASPLAVQSAPPMSLSVVNARLFTPSLMMASASSVMLQAVPLVMTLTTAKHASTLTPPQMWELPVTFVSPTVRFALLTVFVRSARMVSASLPTLENAKPVMLITVQVATLTTSVLSVSQITSSTTWEKIKPTLNASYAPSITAWCAAAPISAWPVPLDMLSSQMAPVPSIARPLKTASHAQLRTFAEPVKQRLIIPWLYFLEIAIRATLITASLAMKTENVWNVLPVWNYRLSSPVSHAQLLARSAQIMITALSARSFIISIIALVNVRLTVTFPAAFSALVKASVSSVMRLTALTVPMVVASPAMSPTASAALAITTVENVSLTFLRFPATASHAQTLDAKLVQLKTSVLSAWLASPRSLLRVAMALPVSTALSPTALLANRTTSALLLSLNFWWWSLESKGIRDFM